MGRVDATLRTLNSANSVEARLRRLGRVKVVGFYGNFVFNGFEWREFDLESFDPHRIALPHLWLIVYDSDLTHVGYQPMGPGTGNAYLGETPRAYFENDDASPPTDTAREAAGLAEFGTLITRGKTVRQASEIEPWLARDEGSEDLELDAAEPAEIFVEIKTADFLEFLGVPLPEALQDLRSKLSQ